jgi:hypothetical protein
MRQSYRCAHLCLKEWLNDMQYGNQGSLRLKRLVGSVVIPIPSGVMLLSSWGWWPYTPTHHICMLALGMRLVKWLARFRCVGGSILHEATPVEAFLDLTGRMGTMQLPYVLIQFVASGHHVFTSGSGAFELEKVRF